jgi:hypothetical protein
MLVILTTALKVTSLEFAVEGLLQVSCDCRNFKATGATYHGASCRYAQDYWDKFSYLLNRRFWGKTTLITTL